MKRRLDVPEASDLRLPEFNLLPASCAAFRGFPENAAFCRSLLSALSAR
jgi:hypothetical protein